MSRIKFVLLFILISSCCFSQKKNDIIDTSFKLEMIADSFNFVEGPTCDRQGNIYFTDIKTSRIYILTVDRKLKLFKEPSNRANGLCFDTNGNLLACEGASRSVTSTSLDGKVTILVDKFRGKKLNSPNDLWIDLKGGIYFTDPRYSNAQWIWVEKGGCIDQLKIDSLYKEEQDTRALYYLSPDKKCLYRVAEGFTNPNGVVGTLDGKKLYVSDTEKKNIYVFDILENGLLSEGKIFLPKYSDGMTLDEYNNLYITNGGIEIYTPEGSLITTIKLPYKSSNICFGGIDRKTLFITARKGVFCCHMKVMGQ
ncbi:SMP-30/gluconolactonase/LRE family protein [Parabacteroides johnsonii]|uniref:SMP-30/Gluconolactonase/LRE-like region domain-containing protein n=1 Tax=Parabacteroides johnsonii CL02T12C29 TaxID=999419 RepID=K5ZIN7_9BACT|nr:SMP-30/gluconolactonase/LRE family protein [Parabacteroides johnsonii]EKN11311.1 hypothetical protein HMPREF1077_01569 [Parabacteroides johnsonii CL02T12C29]